ncbi:RDD family protein [Tessaracoccus antarcticus]|uniref:RDD family protein n=1 Tax=Tessaracoccus antarcticus TaxID=2479848 RepID=UPI0022777740|nr:RDD family protein [Tessaracoccus antarcticus]
MSDASLYPGQTLGLPEHGRGSLAGWWPRIGAMVGDWAASMVIAVALFGTGVINGSGWRVFMVLAVYFVQASVLTALTGGSFGQLIVRIGVIRLDGEPLGWWRPFVRTALKCMVIPHIVVGAERRPLTDMMLSTVVVTRRG